MYILTHMKISKVKLKLSLCIIKHHALNVYGRVDVQVCAVLTFAQDGGGCSDSLPGHLLPLSIEWDAG
jgi:hypothetical protein